MTAVRDLLLDDLAHAVQHEPLRDKILVMPRMSDGVHVLDRLALSGVNWLNVRPATAGTLASTLAKPGLARRGLKEAGEVSTLLLVEEALGHKGDGSAPPGGDTDTSYFGQVPRAPGLVQALHGAVQERLAGIGAADLKESDFVGYRELLGYETYEA